MTGFNKRNSWSNLRYSYYSSGRTDLLLSNFKAGEIMLGYAVESSLKQLLIESGFTDKSVLNKHEIDFIFNVCVKEGLTNNINVSMDFLDYVNNHFLGRYPSLSEKALDRSTSDGMAMFSSIHILSWYDDFIYQINESIVSLTSDISTCIFAKGGLDSDSLKGRLFHHGNYHACHSLDCTVTRIESLGENSHITDRLKRGIRYYWSTPANFVSPGLITPVPDFSSINVEIGFAKNFKGPKFKDTESFSFSFGGPNFLQIAFLPWEPENK